MTISETAGWQPEFKADLVSALARLERELPGWWWRVGACHVSADATIGPDSAGPDAWLLYIGATRVFDEGIDCDLKQPATCGAALNSVIDQALALKREWVEKVKGGSAP